MRNLIGAVVLWCASSSYAADLSVLTCTARMQGVSHKLSITINNNDITELNYNSLNKINGNDCSIHAAASGQDDLTRSEWITWPGVTFIHLLGDSNPIAPQAETHVLIIQSGKEYKVMLQPGVKSNYCASHGVIASSALLRKGSATCILINDDANTRSMVNK